MASTADWFVLLAVLWVAAQADWSGRAVAVLMVCARGPTLIGGLLGGRTVDRFGPRPVLVAGGAFQCCVLLAMAALGFAGALSAVPMLLGAALISLSEPLSYAGARTLVPRLVEDEQLARANTLLAAGDALPALTSSVLVGPALLLLGKGAFAVPAVIMALVAVVAVYLPRTKGRDDPGSAGTPAAAGKNAGKWRSTSVVALLALSTVYFAVYGPFQPVLPYLVRHVYGGDAGSYSLLRVATGVGSLTGLLLGARLARSRRPGVVNALGACAWGLATLPMAFVHSIGPAAVVYFVSGFTWGPYSVVETTALQHWTPRSHHGRVFGIQRALVITAIPVGAAIGSLAMDYVSAQTIVVISTLACVATGLVALCIPAIRRSTDEADAAPGGTGVPADLLESARSAIRRLSAESGVTAAIAVVEDGTLRYVEATTPNGSEDRANLGPVTHLHVASAGKALLAWTEPERVRSLGPLEALTEASITDPEALIQHFHEVRSKGYAASDGEWALDSWAVSAPVFGPSEQPVAFLSMWGPADHHEPDRLQTFGQLARETAQRLSTR